jgi:hypothetical protein
VATSLDLVSEGDFAWWTGDRPRARRLYREAIRAAVAERRAAKARGVEPLSETRAAEARAKQKIIQVKEVKFRPGTDDNDYNVKLRNLTRFLEEGDKAKITLRFRGREMAHQEFGLRLLERIRDDLDGVGLVESMPKLEGRQMIMIISPKKKK